jgi:PRTRC genetic system protein B
MTTVTKVSTFASNSKAAGKLKMGLLFYEFPNKQSVAMRYEWKDDLGFHEPRPLSKEHILDACVHMKETNPECEYVHERIVLRGQNYFGWWCPTKRRRISIAKSKRKVYTHPPMFFIARDYQLYVYELRFNRRPNLNSFIHHARFNGIDVHGGRMGQCNVKIPESMTPTPEIWEDAYFNSRFNTPPHDSRMGVHGKIRDLL